MDEHAYPAGRHRKPVPADLGLPEPDVLPGRAVATAPGSAPSRDVDLARFLAAAREQAAPTSRAAPRSHPARGGRAALVRLRPARGRRASVVLVGLVGLIAILLVWVAHTSGRSSAAAGGPVTTSPAAAAVVVNTSTQQPAAPAASLPAPAPQTTHRVAVVPAVPEAGPPSWPDVVGGLFRARSTAFAQGRPALLLAADAPGSPVLAADQRLFTTVVRSAGYQRVEGLGFDLSAIRTVSQTAAVARLEVTGRQRASRLVGTAGTRAVPAGPVRTVLLELRRSTGSTGWRIETSTAVS